MDAGAHRNAIRRVVVVVVALLALLIPLTSPITAQASSVYRLKSVAAGSSNLCLWPPSSSGTTQLELYACFHGSEEYWNLIQDGVGNQFILQNQYYGGCLDLWQNKQTNRTPAVDYSPCNGGDAAQEFGVTAWGSCSGGTQVVVQNLFGKKLALDDYGASHLEFAIVDFYTWNASPAQLWCLIGL